MTISNNEEYNEKASNVQNETQTVNGSAHPLKQQIQVWCQNNRVSLFFIFYDLVLIDLYIS